MASYAGSADWEVNVASGVIRRGDNKYYFVKPGPYGNPVIVQLIAGDVILTVTEDNMVVCENEKIWVPKSVYRDHESDVIMFASTRVWEEPLEPQASWRVVRKSVDSPDRFFVVGREPIQHLGEAFGNSQRVTGAPENFWFERIKQLPEGTPYFLKTVQEVLTSGDGLGIIALAKAIARHLVRV